MVVHGPGAFWQADALARRMEHLIMDRHQGQLDRHQRQLIMDRHQRHLIMDRHQRQSASYGWST